MAGAKQVIEFALAQGLDTKSDPLHLPQGRMVSLKNATFQEPGGLIKGPRGVRLGGNVFHYTDTTDSKHLDKLYDVYSANGQILVAGKTKSIEAGASPANVNTGPELLAFNGTGWNPVHDFIPTSHRIVDVPGSGTYYDSVDIAIQGDLALIMMANLSSSTESPNATVVNWGTGVTVVPPHDAFGSSITDSRTRACLFGDNFGGLVGRVSSNALVRVIYTISGGQVISRATGTSVSDLNSGDAWDAVSISRKGSANYGITYVAYHSSSAGIKVVRLNASGTITHTHTMAGIAPNDKMSISVMQNGTSEAIIAVWQDSVTFDLDSTILDASDLTDLGSGVVTRIALTSSDPVYHATVARHTEDKGTSTGDLHKFFYTVNQSAVSTLDYIAMLNVDPSDGSAAGTDNLYTHYNSWLQTRGFSFDGHAFVWACPVYGSIEPNVLIGMLGTNTEEKGGRPVAVALSERGYGFNDSGNYGLLTSVYEPEPGVFVTAFMRKDRSLSNGLIVHSPVLVVTKMGAVLPDMKSVPGASFLASGHLLQFSPLTGANDFFTPPAPPVNSATASTGGSMSNGTYIYLVVFEYISPSGEIHRSITSAQTSVTISGGTSTQTVDMDVSYPTWIARNRIEGSTKVALYRTADSGSLFFKVTEIDAAGPGGTGVVTITDTSSDATIIANEPLYTTGGFLDNANALPVSSIALAGDTLLASVYDSPSVVYATKRKQFGESFNFAHEIFIPTMVPDGVKAVATMDGSVIIFGSTSIYTTSGQGFEGTGVGGFSTPVKISGDVGTTNPASVVETRDGVFFNSSRGIYMLGRDRGLRYIGKEVEAYNSLDVARAFSDRTTHRIVFVMSDKKTVLVYDYNIGQWSVYELSGVISATSSDNGIVWITTDGEVFAEDPDGEPIGRMSFETGWIHPVGVLGYCQVHEILMAVEAESGTRLEVEISSATNSYDEALVQKKQIVLKGKTSFRVSPRNQKCSGIKIAMRELEGDLKRVTAMRLLVSAKDKRELPPGLKI